MIYSNCHNYFYQLFIYLPIIILFDIKYNFIIKIKTLNNNKIKFWKIIIISVIINQIWNLKFYITKTIIINQI